MRDIEIVEAEFEGFKTVSEEEILSLWSTFKASGLSGQEAWNAIVIGMALDMVFARTEKLKRVKSPDN